MVFFPRVQQLPSREQWWHAASQSEEKQEQLKQWQHQEGGDEESLELGGGPARDPTTAQNPHQTSSHQVGLMGKEWELSFKGLKYNI